MKRILLLSGLLVSSISFSQVCCNIVDSSGLAVVDSNGNCIIAPNLPSYAACGEQKTVTKPKKIKLKDAEKNILLQALEGVKFKSNSDVLLSESFSKIDAVAELMKNHMDYNLIIDGYTDNQGSASYNQKLSYKRAEAAKARLIKDGISGSRITTHGYGEERPIATNDTAEGRAKNRRVEFLMAN